MTAAAPSAQHALLRATGVMASGTMLSRLLGFVRTILLAFALGNATAQGDVFSLATVVPNSLYMLIAGGTFSSVLVPEIVRHVRSDDDRGEAYVSRIISAFGLGLAVLTVVATVFTPRVMSLWTASVWDEPRLEAMRASLLLMAYLTMPQIFFYGMFFLIGQILNAREDFRPLAWAPIVNNVVQVAVLGGYAAVWAGQRDHGVPFTDPQALVLGLGSTLGIVAQTVALLPAWRRLGLRFRPRLDLAGSGLGATFQLAKWAIGVTILIQLAALVVARLAGGATVADPSRPGPGLLAYNEAYLTWLLPHSLVTVSLATAMLPAASRLAAASDLGGVAADVARAQRLALALAVPAAVGFIVLADPYASLVFGNGAGASDWHAVSATLACLALGLLPYTIQYVYFRGFYAVQQLGTVFVLQAWTSAANVALALGWVALDPNPLTVAPRLAACYGASYLLGAVLTTRALNGRLPGLDVPGMIQQLARATLAVAPGALLAWGITVLVAPRGKAAVAAGFVLGGVVLVGCYLLLARRLGVAELSDAVGLVTRRLGRGRGRDGSADAAPIGASDAEGTTADAAWVIEEEIGALGPYRSPLLTLPDPAYAAGIVPDDGPTLAGRGDLLGGRLRLDWLLHRRPGAESWLAYDTVLPRPALVALLPADDPGTPAVLDAARAASAVTDERLLRTVDVRAVAGLPYGGYLQYEYTPAQALELLLRHGPLSQLAASWLVRELAESLAGVHARGQAHRRISPDTVFITGTGDVKVVGLGVEAALNPDSLEPADGTALDVIALGRLLYCSLTACWPNGQAYGLPAAPSDGRGRPFSADAVRAGIAPEVADIADRIINPQASGRPPLASAYAVAEALGAVVGTANASDELRHRLELPLPAGASSWADHTPVPPPAASDSDDIEAAGSPAALAGATWQRTRGAAGEGVGDDPDATAPLDLDALDDDAQDVPGLDDAPKSQPTPPAIAPQAGPPIRNGWVVVLAAGFVLALLAGVAGVFVNQYKTSSAPPAPGPVAIASVRDFDPDADGGDGKENGAQARLATDGRPDTAWHSETYGRTAAFNGRKPGVGLLLDLGTAQAVSSVRVTVAGGRTDLQLRVPVEASPTSAPMATQDDWKVVASAPGASGETTLTPAAPLTTRYLLVYVTKLPPAEPGPGYQAGIAEVVVLS